MKRKKNIIIRMGTYIDKRRRRRLNHRFDWSSTYFGMASWQLQQLQYDILDEYWLGVVVGCQFISPSSFGWLLLVEVYNK